MAKTPGRIKFTITQINVSIA